MAKKAASNVAPILPPAPASPVPGSSNLDKPFSWEDPDFAPLLERLQGNILKGHGREHTANIFIKVLPGKAEEARGVLKLLGTQYVTSSLKQLNQTEEYKRALYADKTVSSDPFLGVFLSHAGYVSLEIPAGKIPTDSKFISGMRGSKQDLNDPDSSAWDKGYKTQPDGMLLAADTSPEKVSEFVALLENLLSSAFEILHKQTGKAIKNSRGEGLEHFGYVDGRSQPLFLNEDIARELKDGGGIMWDPAFPPSRVILPDPGAANDGKSFGSYFIFRKLEERVREFKTAEQELAEKLGLKGQDRELAGGLCVGRFEDGTPVTLSKQAIAPPSGQVVNDFNYDQDPSGGKCPFHAHIRKTNPRGTSDIGIPNESRPEKEDRERLTIMARRGITYEDVPREVHPDDLPESINMTQFLANVAPLLPEGDLGLLFMAYNVDIAQQFEVTQRFWANSENFPQAGVGTDPVLGQPSGVSTQNWPTTWGQVPPTTLPISFQGHVKMKGGEYFFAPSLTFLKTL